jgi:hypothetical protein
MFLPRLSPTPAHSALTGSHCGIADLSDFEDDDEDYNVTPEDYVEIRE